MLKNRNSFHGYDLITTSGGPTHQSTDSEKATQRRFLKYKHALKSHPNVQVHVNCRLLFYKLNDNF